MNELSETRVNVLSFPNGCATQSGATPVARLGQLAGMLLRPFMVFQTGNRTEHSSVSLQQIGLWLPDLWIMCLLRSTDRV
jgi:hypothetical protein